MRVCQNEMEWATKRTEKWVREWWKFVFRNIVGFYVVNTISVVLCRYVHVCFFKTAVFDINISMGKTSQWHWWNQKLEAFQKFHTLVCIYFSPELLPQCISNFSIRTHSVHDNHFDWLPYQVRATIVSFTCFSISISNHKFILCVNNYKTYITSRRSFYLNITCWMKERIETEPSWFSVDWYIIQHLLRNIDYYQT